jgi:hypothetical protein
MNLTEALRGRAVVCPCSVPKPKDAPNARRYPMEICGPEGCRRCRGTGLSAYCVECFGTGQRSEGTCTVCDGVGRHPGTAEASPGTETVNVQGALL